MTNELTLESARNLSTSDLLNALAEGLMGMADTLRKAAIAYVVLKERGAAPPIVPNVLDSAEHIATGRLSPAAALRLGGRGMFLAKHIMDLPHDLQNRLADGEKVKIARRSANGIQSAECSIYKMEAVELRLAFTEGKVTPWEEQAGWLHTSGYAAPPKKVKIRSDVKAGEIIIGTKRIRHDDPDLRQALANLGLMVVPIYKASRPRSVPATTD